MVVEMLHKTLPFVAPHSLIHIHATHINRYFNASQPSPQTKRNWKAPGQEMLTAFSTASNGLDAVTLPPAVVMMKQARHPTFYHTLTSNLLTTTENTSVLRPSSEIFFAFFTALTPWWGFGLQSVLQPKGNRTQRLSDSHDRLSAICTHLPRTIA
jgi:hypothetical protein